MKQPGALEAQPTSLHREMATVCTEMGLFLSLPPTSKTVQTDLFRQMMHPKCVRGKV